MVWTSGFNPSPEHNQNRHKSKRATERESRGTYALQQTMSGGLDLTGHTIGDWCPPRNVLVIDFMVL